SYGWGSAGRFHQPSLQLFRFLRHFGGYTDARGTYSSSAADAIIPYFFGMAYGQAVGQQTSWSQIVGHADLIVSFGSLRLNNAQVTYGGQGPHLTRHWLEAAKERGIQFVNIGPLRDDEEIVDSRWLPARPGTDVALMAGLIHTLADERLADEDFLQRYCVGWEPLQAYLFGVSDGQPKDAEWAAAITGLDASTIRSLAREMAGRRTLVNLSLSVQRTDHGEQAYWMGCALAAALGQIGLPGGGLALPFGANGNVGAGQIRKRIPGPPTPRMPPGMPVISVSRVVEMLEQPGQPYDFNGRRGVYPDIRLVYWVGGNVFHHHQDLNRLVRAWQKPETIIVHEPFWTPMAKRADIVLPATTPLERNDLGGAETMLVAMKAVLAPHADARDDYAILAALAERLDFGFTFTEGRSADEWLRFLYEEFRADNDYAPDFDTFWASDYLIHADMAPMGETNQVFLQRFRADPESAPLGTPSGRIELYSETIAGFGYGDCPPLPTWIEPYERLGTDAAGRFGLHLVSNQPRTRLHSQYDHSAISQATKVAGREPVRMHPADAADRGISDGDLVRVFNDRGACLGGAVISDAVARNVVQMATGTWFDPDETGMCRAGNPNVLTRDKGTSSLAQGPSAHTCLVEVDRYPGEPPPVTAYDPPAFTADR
ncbi:MAG: molybdopterin-dependent oxidoreductase, partial [Actinomycetota bacterium]|nr:molybdopterin-dependent oxidoreductase [Actinomycetota bacterium]